MRLEFQTHLLNEQGRIKARHIAETFQDCLNDLEKLCGADGRLMAMVRTKLEEACFFAKKACSGRPEFQDTGLMSIAGCS